MGLALMAGLILFSGCQGSTSSKPPVHINPNMDFQEKFEAQEVNTFFADSRAMRAPVQGTVARGYLKADNALYRGRTDAGELLPINPLRVTTELMERGQERFEIFCAVCHGSAGDGQGIIMTGNYGYVPAPTFHTTGLRALPDGHFFNAMTVGIRTMPSYASQIPVKDRWAIVAYIRALQRSQYASASDVSESQR
jgi:mono/diheme cytochrome c family protein